MAGTRRVSTTIRARDEFGRFLSKVLSAEVESQDAMQKRAVKTMRDVIRPHRKSGALGRSIGARKNPDGSVSVGSNLKYAHSVDQGTAPHTIKGHEHPGVKKGLHFTDKARTIVEGEFTNAFVEEMRKRGLR